jgi:hypothetical protein
VKFEGKWGSIDERGREVIPPKYDYPTDANGRALVNPRGFIQYKQEYDRDLRDALSIRGTTPRAGTSGGPNDVPRVP